ncbi:MAG: hypothetical protein PHF86_13085 [Candidatus Nanoarchaeia archaeon]|jgi:hypothetical protein|nr:hypothetical protein [Candidatus Nanoarchaeia archaeon]
MAKISESKKEFLIREIFLPWKRGIKKYFAPYRVDGVLFKSKYHKMSAKRLFREFEKSPSLEELYPNDFMYLDHYSGLLTQRQKRIKEKRLIKWEKQRKKRLKEIKMVCKINQEERKNIKKKELKKLNGQKKKKKSK